MKINGFFLFLVVFLVTMVLASVFYPLRYIKYMLPLIPLSIYFRTRALSVDKNIFWYYYSFILFYGLTILYLLIQALFLTDLSGRFFPNAVFILSPLLFLAFILPYFNADKTRQYVRAILFINIGIFFYEEGFDFLSVITDLDVLKNGIISSEFPTENNLAYLFGFLVIYFFIEKYPRWYQILAFIFFVLCFKRIVIAAVMISCAAYFTLSLFHIRVTRYRKLLTILGISVNLLFVKFTHLIVTGKFDAFVFEKTGFSTDRFMMGRKTFYTEAFEKAGTINWMGSGLGQIDDIMYNFYGIPVNLHSEVLKNYFEFGIVIFVAWLFIVFYKNLFSNKAAVVLLYFNILILTDNVFIYFEIMFYFYFFILIFLHQKHDPLKNLENESIHS
ncbi:MAG: hypothetical protein ABIR06_15880 [Cyclobacteriaceae bacterium]